MISCSHSSPAQLGKAQESFEEIHSKVKDLAPPAVPFRQSQSGPLVFLESIHSWSGVFLVFLSIKTVRRAVSRTQFLRSQFSGKKVNMLGSWSKSLSRVEKQQQRKTVGCLSR